MRSPRETHSQMFELHFSNNLLYLTQLWVNFSRTLKTAIRNLGCDSRTDFIFSLPLLCFLGDNMQTINTQLEIGCKIAPKIVALFLQLGCESATIFGAFLQPIPYCPHSFSKVDALALYLAWLGISKVKG